ncbi:MAG: asparaginase [Candidatus Wallbacteria bacterium]|nr:asparaginase [Candidatus Wallbacteria bacterium]
MATATPAVNAKPLVLSYRGPVLENVFFGHAVAYDAHGRRLFSLGNSARLTPVRSCLKPFQALPILMDEVPAHFRPEERELAIMCGSHAAEAEHLATVRAILSRAGAGEGELGCGAPPGKGSRIYHNCSGKHSGMLLWCAARGFPKQGYLDPQHPLQERILSEVLKLSRSVRPEVPVLVDGCGAPVPALPLEKIAWLYAQLAKPTGLPGALAAGLTRAAAAMRAHPVLVSGTGLFDTRVNQVTGGQVIAKCGADGLACLAHRDSGTGIAVKSEAPDIPMAQAAALGVLKRLSLLSAAHYETLAAEFLAPRRNSIGQDIGRVQLAGELA